MTIIIAIIFGLLVAAMGILLGKWATKPIGFSTKTDSDRFYGSVTGG